MKKFTKEELGEILHKNILSCKKDEVAFLFNIFGLSVKEWPIATIGKVEFEIHFKRIYIMKVIAKPDGFEYTNEYINFQFDESGKASHSITSPLPPTMADVIVSFINIFTPNVLKNAGYEVSWDPTNSAFESVEEAQEYLTYVQKVTDEIIGSRPKQEEKK